MKFPGKFKITRDDAMTVYYMANSRKMSLRMGTRTHILLSSARNTLSHEKVLLGEAHLDRNRHVQLFFLNKIQHPVNKSTKIIYQQVQKTSAYIPPPPHTHPPQPTTTTTTITTIIFPKQYSSKLYPHSLLLFTTKGKA